MFDHRDTKFSECKRSYVPSRTDTPVTRDTMLSFVEQASRGFFNGSPGCHAWDHTLRVVRLSERIAFEEGADPDVVIIAAYLHDIGRAHQDAARGRICHARQGAELAGPIVARLPLADEQKENIVHCIRTHRFRSHALPETLEARVLFDADKLDAIGAIGIARAYLFAGEIGARLHVPELDIESSGAYTENDTGYREYQVKLCKIKERMTTACGKQLARERHQFMQQFFNRFSKEFEGKG